MLRTYIDANQLDCNKWVAACSFMYNTSVHTSTGNTPFFLIFGRDPTFNIDLLIKHDLERHISMLTDSSLYVANLVATLHAAWRAAAASNDRQRTKYKKQFDASHFSPLTIKVGDRVYLRDFAPTPGLSQKLCMPWLGQFKVIEKAWSVPVPSFSLLFVAVRTELEPMEPETPADPGKCDFSSSQPCDGSLQDLVDDVETPMDTSDDVAIEQPPPEPEPICPAPTAAPYATVAGPSRSSPVFFEDDFPPLSKDTSPCCVTADAKPCSVADRLDLSDEALLASDGEEASRAPPVDTPAAADLAHSMEDLSVGTSAPDPVLSPAGSLDTGPSSSSTESPGPSGGKFPKSAVHVETTSTVTTVDGYVHFAQGASRRGQSFFRRGSRPARGSRFRQRGRTHPPAPPQHYAGPSAQLPEFNPKGFTHHLINSHPWGYYVNPRPISLLREDAIPVTTQLSTEVYKHLPDAGYMRLKFAKSLFPQVPLRVDRPPARIPFIEHQHLEDTVAFRERSQRIIDALMAGTYENADVSHLDRTPKNQNKYIDGAPPILNDNRRPVLYQ
ncbi:unnamed protein product, partial [Heligmosomoides polygyrus]|uniref:Integrase catalytic domain-containing protein n=1 Tax=Heligmosomoides polygyrus TaxID=6339 RepID=A0A183F919_HELPZ